MKVESVLAASLVLLLTGCSGNIGTGSASPGGSGANAGSGASGGRPGSGGNGPSGGTTTAPPLPEADPQGKATCTGGLQPAAAYMRRLTNDEYIASASSVLGLPEQTASAVDLLKEGFGNTATSLGVSTSHMERYLAAANKLAEAAVGSAAARKALAGCDDVGHDPCLTNTIKAVGRRAYRRTLTNEEVQRLQKLAANASADPDATMPAKVALQGLLISPNFLYRVETGGQATASGWRKLTGPEVASRLSYFILGTTPDNTLIDEAEKGTLDTVDGVRKRAEAMLDDPRAQVGLARAVSSWLHLYDIDQLARTTTQYPQWSEDLRGSMREETKRVLDDFLWSKSANLFDALTAPYTYVDARLAKLYGITGVTGDWQKVSFTASDKRAGLLTQASLLALPVSGTDVTAAILRGKYVRDAFLCSAPGAPPPDVPPVPTDTNLTARERLAQHRTNPSCTACHQLLDPVGFAFEQFDGIGAYRDKGSKGEALTGEGKVFGVTGDPTVQGPKELAGLLKTLPEVRSCTVNHIFEYAYGRVPTVEDSCAREEAVKAFQQGGNNFRGLVLSLVTSDAFRNVTGEK